MEYNVIYHSHDIIDIITYTKLHHTLVLCK